MMFQRFKELVAAFLAHRDGSERKDGECRYKIGLSTVLDFKLVATASSKQIREFDAVREYRYPRFLNSV